MSFPGSFLYEIYHLSLTYIFGRTLAKNIVKFVTDNDLDGVDFDWEYPGVRAFDPFKIDLGN